MALMLRETDGNNFSDTQALVPLNETNAISQQVANIDEKKINPQELGQVIVLLQEEIKVIKAQLENLPGYAIGEVPPHLMKLKIELESTFNSLDKKNEILIQAMTKNFGKTQQDLPNFKMPESLAIEGSAGATSLLKKQTDILDLDQCYGAAIQASQLEVRSKNTAGILKKTLTSVAKTYAPKHTVPVKPRAFQERRPDNMNDPPPISEDDINQGMFSLVNRGMIPKDVDLTPAFEKGAPPVQARGVKFYDKSEQYVKREMMTGGTHTQAIKYDLQPVQIAPIQQQENGTQMQVTTKQLALMSNATESPFKKTRRSVMAGTGAMIVASSSAQIIESEQGSPAKSLMAESQVADARDYNELMDEYSLHQLIVRKGELLEQTPEFQSFKRTYIQKWGQISYIIMLLTKMLGESQVQMAYIEGRKVAQLAVGELDLKHKPTTEQLFDCIVNQDEVGRQIKVPSLMYKGHDGPIIAATNIQKNWRMHKAKVAYSYLLFLMKKATVIQRGYRLYQFQKQTKDRVEELTNESLFVWKEMMEEFKQKWPAIKNRKRVEIHINSFSIDEIKRMSMEKFLQRENSQISRIFCVKDPNVDVIYISPYQMTPDVLGYYMKILEIGEIDQIKKRVTFLTPENIDKFPNHFSLTQMLIYSPKTVKRLKSLIKGKQAYIVPGQISTDDIKLSIRLAIPILSGEPQKQNLYSTKSGAKKIFQLADVPTAISSVDIYDEQEFHLSLAKLIAHNLYVHTWIFKIDDEFGGRGHAYLNIDQVKALQNLRKKPIAVGDSLVEQIVEILTKALPKKAIIPLKNLYHSWSEYLEAFCRVGGVIEAAPTCLSNQMASPSIAFIIEPDGEVELIGSLDKYAAREYVNAGCFFPQQSLPNMNMKTICNSIGEVLYEKGVIGHITVDLVSFPDPTSPNSHPLFWAVDLNCHLTDYASACFFFDFLMEGTLDQFSGKYMINNSPEEVDQRSRLSSRLSSRGDEESPLKAHNRSTSSYSKGSGAKSTASSLGGHDYSEPRTFMYCRYLHHPGIAKIQYKTFFHMCRLRSISFDLERRQGTTFMLQDCLQSGIVALMTIAEERTEALQQMTEAFKFIEELAGNTALMQRQKIGCDTYESRSDGIDAGDVISAVRLIYKTYQKKATRERQARENRISKKL